MKIGVYMDFKARSPARLRWYKNCTVTTLSLNLPTVKFKLPAFCQKNSVFRTLHNYKQGVPVFKINQSQPK